MRILVDTHIALWVLYAPERLSKEALKILQNGENEFYYSTISVWEIFIKKNLHPEIHLADGEKFARDCEKAGFNVLPLFNRHVYALRSIILPDGAPRHKDPFDRMLLAQAKVEAMNFLTHDTKIPFYHKEFIISV